MGIKIMIIMDGPIICDKINDIMDRHLIEPIYTTGLGDALKSIEAYENDFVLIDVDFFDSSADFCTTVRRIRPNAIICCIANAEMINSQEVMAAGFDFRFSKPMDKDFFLEILSKTFDRKIA